MVHPVSIHPISQVTADAVWAPHTMSPKSSGQRAADPPRGPLFFLCVFFVVSLPSCTAGGLISRPAGHSLGPYCWCEHQAEGGGCGGEVTGDVSGSVASSNVQTTARRVRLQPAGLRRCRSSGLETYLTTKGSGSGSGRLHLQAASCCVP